MKTTRYISKKISSAIVTPAATNGPITVASHISDEKRSGAKHAAKHKEVAFDYDPPP